MAKHNKVPASELQSRLNAIHGKNTYKIVGNVKTTISPTRLLHKDCNKVFKKPIYLLFDNRDHRNGHCPNCKLKPIYNKGLSNEEYCKRLKKIHGNTYSILEIYTGWDNIIKYRHNKCGKISKLSAGSLLDDRAHCTCLITDILIKYTKEDHQRRLNKKYGRNTYKIKGEAKRVIDIVKIKHKNCGKVFKLTLSQFFDTQKLNKEHCPNCKYTTGGCVPITHEQFVKKLGLVYGKNEYKLLSKYKNSHSPIKYQHKCGLKYTFALAGELLNGKNHCKCLNKRLMTKEKHDKWIKENRSDFECMEFNGSRDSINTYKHKVCGKTYKVSLGSFILTKYCPHCHGEVGQYLNRLSREEIEKRIKKTVGTTYKVINTNYLDRKIEIQHKCKHTYWVRFDSLRARGSILCPMCFFVSRLGGIKCRKIKGKVFKYQGYEEPTLLELSKKYNINNIITGCDTKNRKRIHYKINGVDSTYIPDFYIRKANLLIEVKSDWTLGLKGEVFGNIDTFKRNCAKTKQCIKLGYRFELHLYQYKEGELQRLNIPDNWYEYTKRQLNEYIKENN